MEPYSTISLVWKLPGSASSRRSECSCRCSCLRRLLAGRHRLRRGFRQRVGQLHRVPDFLSIVDDTTMKKVAQLSGGTAYSATTLQQLTDVYATLQQQIGFDTIKGDASTGWLRLAALAVSLAALAALLINRRLPA